MSFEEQLRRAFDAAIAEATAAAREKEALARREGADEGYARGFEEGRAKAIDEGKDLGIEEGRARGIEEGRLRGIEEGRAQGIEQGHGRGIEEGRARGIEEGVARGIEQGRAKGFEEGRERGLREGHERGLEEGRANGINEGFEQGIQEGRKAGEQAGWRLGWNEGHAKGFEEGLAQGREQARREAQEQIDAAVTAAHAATAEAAAAAAATPKTVSPDHLVEGLREIDSARSLSEVLDTLLGCARREAPRAALFLVRTGRFRSWRVIGFDALDHKPPFDVDVREAGIIADALRTKAAAKSGPGAHSGAAAFAALAPDRIAVASPIVLAGEVVAVLYVDDQESEKAAAGAAVVNLDVVDALARHAARCLESLTAIRTARAVADPRDADGNGESDGDAAARSYAKLLVSEIRMYHEPEVVAGWRERDLGRRLRSEIARARGLYEERVPPAVRERADYFNDELVRTLANGDATLLQLT